MGPRFEKIELTNQSLCELEQELIERLPLSVQMLILCRLAKDRRFPEKMQVEFFRYVDTDNEGAEQNNGDKAEAYPHNDDDKHRSFIVCVERPNLHTRKGVILLTPPSPTQKMVDTFDSWVGWEECQLFHCVQPPFWKPLQELCARHGNTHPDRSKGIPGIMLAMLDIEKAGEMEVQVEPGTSGFHELRVGKLEESDVPTVIENWKWAVKNHSEREMKKCIKTLVSCGVFVKEEPGQEFQIASHVLLSPIGEFNVLFTPDKFKRRGLAKLVMRSVSQQVATRFGIHPMAEVEIWNDASKTLLEKIGYQEVFKTRWFYYQPRDILI